MPAQAVRVPEPPSPILLREQAGNVAVLTLNRPAARNSLSEALIAELHGALRQIGDDAKVRAVVIAANGSAFSAGHDMKELTARRTDADRGRAYFAQIMNACSAMMQAIERARYVRPRSTQITARHASAASPITPAIAVALY